MTQFDKINTTRDIGFIRHDPQMLKAVYGTADLEPFWVADMDFQVAPAISNALRQLADRAHFAYEFNSKAVFQAQVDWYRRRHNLKLQPDNLVQVPGVLTGIALLLRELSEPGDGVLIQTPVYHQFKKVIGTADRTVVRSPLVVRDGHYQMDFDNLEKHFAGGKVKVMLLCNPHNPVGRVWTRAELSRLLALAKTYRVVVISDEIHSDILFGDHSFHSLAGFEGEHIVSLIGSPAKTFGLQSISNGYIYTPNRDLLTRLKAIQDALYLGHSNVFGNYATIAAFTEGEAWLDELLDYLQTSIDWIAHFLEQQLPGVRMFPVEGTYQIWLDFSGTGHSADHVKQALIDARMALTPGAWFDSDNDWQYRMNIASPQAKIQAAFKRLKSTL